MTTEDIPYLKPTFFPSVPRLWNVLYAKMKAQFDEASGVWGNIMRKALETKLANIRNDGTFTHWLYDRIVFSKIKA